MGIILLRREVDLFGPAHCVVLLHKSTLDIRQFYLSGPWVSKCVSVCNEHIFEYNTIAKQIGKGKLMNMEEFKI